MTVLNTPAEVHAAAIGVFAGGIAGLRDDFEAVDATASIATGTPVESGHRRDLQDEAGYYAGAAVIAYVIARWLG